MNYKCSSILKEARDVIETLHSTALVMKEDDPLEELKKTKKNETIELQNRINELAKQRNSIVDSEKQFENEKMLQRVFHIYQIIHFHKLLTTKSETWTYFHFSAVSVPKIIKEEMTCNEICELLLNILIHWI
jgi:hypothetical protein